MTNQSVMSVLAISRYLLTDELSSLSSNYKAMSENKISLGDEQNKIRSTLNSHADIISDAGLSVKPEGSNQSESISVSSKPISTFISSDVEES